MAYDLIKISALPAATPDESQEIVVGVGDLAKRINYGDVKADMVGTSPTYTTDTEPYLQRRTAHVGVVGKCALDKLVGGSLGWNQLCNGSSVTVPNGHKYYMKKSGTASIGASTGSALTGLTSGTDMVIDLTVALGSTIADYIYQLETATAGSGIAKLKSWGIDLDTYHAYDAGSIQSVQATAHVTTGKNLLDVTNETSGSNAHIREYNLPNLPLGTYTISAKCVSTASTDCAVLFIYKDGTNTASPMLTNGSWSSQTFNLTKPVKTLRIYSANGYSASLSNTVVVTSAQLEFGSTATAYEPYTAHTYSLGSDTLRGYPMLVNNKLAFDGDIKTPDGTIRRRYGIANINDLTFTYDSTNKWLMGSSALPNSISSITATPNSMTDMPYDAVAANTLNVNTKAWTLYTGKVVVKDSSLTEAQLRAAISGKHIVYPLATETTESGTAYQKIQTIDADGTESFTTSSPVPVGHETQTPDNILAALEWLGE